MSVTRITCNLNKGRTEMPNIRCPKKNCDLAQTEAIFRQEGIVVFLFFLMVFALSPPKFICKIIRRARRRNAWTSIVGWFHLEAQVHVKIGNYCNVTGVIRVTDTCNKFSGKSCVFA